jgi:hypothetical protein
MNFSLLTVIVLVGLSLSVFIVTLIRRGPGLTVQKVEDLEEKIEIVDLLAFRNLVDLEETQLLRERLPASVYRRIQRLRVRAAMAYVQCVYRNAGLTIRLAAGLASNPDAEVRQEAKKIQDLSVQSRIFAIKSLLKLAVSFTFPSMSVSVYEVAAAYVQVADRMESLCTLIAPLHTSRISAAFR